MYLARFGRAWHGVAWHGSARLGVTWQGKGFARYGESVTNPDPTRLVDGYYHLPPPAEATDAIPGTPEKVEVLRRRVERGEGLWHPGDATAQGRTSVLRLRSGGG